MNRATIIYEDEEFKFDNWDYEKQKDGYLTLYSDIDGIAREVVVNLEKTKYVLIEKGIEDDGADADSK